MRTRTLTLTLTLTLAFVGCGKKAASGLDRVNDAFVSAGLKLDPFVPTDASRFSAQKCLSGRIEGVDAVLCEYGSDEAAHHGHKAGEDWIATATTGAALESGRVLLALADRGRADPNGRAIHKITQAFLGKK